MNLEFWVYPLPTEVSQAADFSHIQSSILQFDPCLFISTDWLGKGDKN